MRILIRFFLALFLLAGLYIMAACAWGLTTGRFGAKPLVLGIIICACWEILIAIAWKQTGKR